MGSTSLESIHRKVKSLYKSSVRSIAIKFGFHNFVRNLYGRVIVQLSNGIQTHEIAGIAVKYETASYSAWERQRSFKGETPVMEQFVDDVESGKKVWDIGANMGTYTCLAGRAAENVSVVAFEPAPENRSRLHRNIELNKIDATVREEALDSEPGEMRLSSRSNGDGQYALTSGQDGFQVPTIDADSLVEQDTLSQPDVVKMDVEGAELRVLQGMESVLNDVDLLYLEVHPSRIAEYGGCIDEIKSRISAAGLSYEQIHRRGDQYFLRAFR